MRHSTDFIEDMIDAFSEDIISEMPDSVSKSDLYPPRDLHVSVISTEDALHNYFRVLDDLRSACYRLYESADLDQLVDEIIDDYRDEEVDTAFDLVKEEYGQDAAYEVATRIITGM